MNKKSKTTRYHYTHIRMAKIQNSDDTAGEQQEVPSIGGQTQDGILILEGTLAVSYTTETHSHVIEKSQALVFTQAS